MIWEILFKVALCTFLTTLVVAVLTEAVARMVVDNVDNMRTNIRRFSKLLGKIALSWLLLLVGIVIAGMIGV